MSTRYPRIRRSLERLGLGTLQIASGAQNLLEHQQCVGVVNRLIENADVGGLKLLQSGQCTAADLVRLESTKQLPPPRKARRLRADTSYVYAVERIDTAEIKIGTAWDVAARLSSIQTDNAGELRLLWAIRGGAEVERRIHRRFAALRIRGEWFRGAPEIYAFAGDASLREAA